MSRVHRIFLGVGLALLWVYVSAGSARAQEPDLLSAVQAWERCSIQRYGLPADHVRAAQDLLQPAFLVRGYGLRSTYSAARALLAESSPPRLSLDTLGSGEVPLWRTQPIDWVQSAVTPLELTHGVNACLPYPVKSVSAVPTSIVRGFTWALALELDRPATCQYTLFGETGPCYSGEALDAYVLAGLSALLEPGRYPLQIEVVLEDYRATLVLPLDITPGTYGFQFIDPPEALNRLMDPELMVSEGAFLAQWRTLRSPDKHWDLPLAFPLPQHVAVTAPYGDRRSYGGMVDGYHSGVDYAAWGGMEVLAPADGVVVMVELLEMRGNSVLIDHGWGLVSGYWHLSSVDVQVGDWVSRGQPFAHVGSTGLSTGPHLHWEMWANGVSVDGRQWLDSESFHGVVFPPSKPLPSVAGDE